MVQRIVEGCPCLLYLNLSCTLITNKTLRELSRNCLNLQYLSLAYCYRFTDKGFMYLTTGNGCHNLVHLNLSGCTQMTVNGFRYISAGCPSLKEIVINDMPTLSDSCVLVCINGTISMFFLVVVLYPMVSDTGIQYLTEGSSSTKLRELNVSYCSLITDTSVMRIAQRLCKLYHLNLSYCERLTDMSLEWVSGSSICSLDISGCNIQDQKYNTIQLALVENSLDLEHVDVSHCGALSDSAIRAVSFYCRGLVTLRMSGCPKMTDMAVQYLTSGSQYLRELDVSGCVLLTDRSLRRLERVCPPLGSISMVCCSSISKVAALKLRPHVKHWEHSNDNPPYWFGYNMGQIVSPVTRPIKTDDTKWRISSQC
uniref:F-box and leucine-rich repeat protein 13 n=1 Tax=Cyclopterus lumpus TaxID=8103 RepID=A0A8C3A6J0_CYCLU